MKINDLEKLLGIKRSNIFYYEREGLLAPRREENNYREYSEDDLRRLKTVVVLRKLGFTVAEIKALLDGERDLGDVLPENLTRLEEQSAELAEAAALCRTMERRGLTMADFDPDEWFERIEAEERQGKRFPDLVGDMADDVTKTLAFVQGTVGFYGPVWANFFLSEEGIKKRRLWKLYWGMLLAGYLLLLGEIYLLPGNYIRLADPWAALVYTLIDGIVGSLVLVLCARYVIPGRKPRQAFWLTIAIMTGVHLCLGLVARQAYRTEIDVEARSAWQISVGQGPYTGDDPVGYVQQSYNQKYYGGRAELDVWENDRVLVVFTSRGPMFYFTKNDDGLWAETYIPRPVDGVMYTADPYGPRQYPSRLMLADGTSVEPVYEARFSTGYVPLYAFDVSAGQEYTGIEYGVDAAGGLRYEIDRAEYSGASDWTPPIDENERKWTHSLGEVLGTDAGGEFLAAYRAWRADVWAAEPAYESGSAFLGVSSKYALYAEYIAPPSLVLRQEEWGYTDDWGLNEFSDSLLFGDQGPYLLWQMNCEADVTGLLSAQDVTPALLQSAAATVRSNGFTLTNPGTGIMFGDDLFSHTASRYWKVTLPAELIGLGGRTFSQLNP